MTGRGFSVKTVLQDAAGANGPGVVANVAGLSSAGLAVSGTFTATINFEASLDGSNWFALGALPASGGAAVTTATSAGLFTCAVGGLAQVRARVSGFSTGAVTCTLLASVAADLD